MSFISASYSVKKLSDKRYTSENTALTVEAFVSPFDINANEVYTDFRYIPTSSAGIPYSGSSQNLGIVSASVTDTSIVPEDDVAVLKYWYRKKVRRSNQGGRDTFFFVEDDGFGPNDAVFNDQLITSSQQTNFISPKYVRAEDAGNNTESPNPGYKINVSVGANVGSATAVNNLTYTFDYKTGVLTFLPNQTPTAVNNTSNFVFITAYQYVGRTLRSQIDDGSIGGSDFTAAGISGSFIATSASIAADIAANSASITVLEANEVHTAAAISGSTQFTVAGQDDSFTVGQESTINFISGSAGITVLNDSTDTITIGVSTDDVTFNSVTADTLTGTASFASNVAINKLFTDAVRPIILSQTTTPNGQLGYVSGSGFAGFTYNTVTSELAINGLNSTDQLTISTSSIEVQSITSYDLLNTNVTTLNFGGAATNINMGASNGTVTIAGSASIAGDLTVQGTTTSIQTENLNVSDQFILLASGSEGTLDGGIIVQSGSNGVGTALYFDANSNRWAVNPANTVNWNDTSLTPKQYVVSVSASNAAPPTTPLDFGDGSKYYGMMHINSANEDIYIYS